MNNKTQDPLARWWWPGQWLHIVYGVWIDQLWYWQNVCPRLRDRKEGRAIFIQGALGAVFAALFLSAIMGGVLIVLRVQVSLRSLVQGTMLGVLVAVILNVVLAIGKNMNRVVVYSIVSDTLIVVTLSLMSGVFHWSVDRSLLVIVTIDGIMSAILGLSVNVAECVLTGDARNIRSAISWGILVGIITPRMVDGIKSISGFIVVSVILATVAILSYGTGLYCGGHWATRQVPDQSARRHLASLSETMFGGHDD